MFNETLDCYNVVGKKEEERITIKNHKKYLPYQIIRIINEICVDCFYSGLKISMDCLDVD